jgi:AraC-like DNA-binding protein
LYKFEHAVPLEPLNQFISMFYRFETDGNEPGDFERADIAHCRFRFGGSGIIRFGTGSALDLPESSVIGPRNRASFISGGGDSVMFGFGLLPAGWSALTGVGAAAYVDKIVSAPALLGDVAHAIRAALAPAMTIGEMAKSAQAILEPACRTAENTPFWFFAAVDAWLANTLVPDLEELAAHTRLSHRKIESLFRDHYGATPKLFIRKSKALRVANRIAHGEGDWQDYVGEEFYDQSHFIREIKHFTGITPAAIREARTNMSQMQFQRRRLLKPIDA